MNVRAAVLAVLVAGCSPPPVAGGGGGAAATGGGAASNGGGAASNGGGASSSGGGAASSGGGAASSGGGSATGGGTTDGGSAGWQWLAIPGSLCGSGSTAGIAINPGSSDRLFIYMQGGGACWNTGTCRPSYYQFGPICYYGTVCLVSGQGADQPLAVHVIDSDPYPADGGGALPGDLAVLDAVKALDRSAPDNPFRDATFVYVPYCTGDLHSGNTTHDYPYKLDLVPGTVHMFTMHFAGAANMDLFLAKLKQLYPSPQTVWLSGSSAGGYGATFNFDRVARAFSAAQVHMLADSAPFIETIHFNEWRDAWSMQFPAGCTQCSDGGLSAVTDYLTTAWPDRRIGLLSYDQDQVIRYFFYGGSGPDQVATPPLGPFTTALGALEDRYDAHANTQYFVAPGSSHVLWGDYGTRLADGGYSAPRPSRDGGSDLKRFIDGWALGDAGFASTR